MVVMKYLIYRLPCFEHEKGVWICVDPIVIRQPSCWFVKRRWTCRSELKWYSSGNNEKCNLPVLPFRVSTQCAWQSDRMPWNTIWASYTHKVKAAFANCLHTSKKLNSLVFQSFVALLWSRVPATVAPQLWRSAAKRYIVAYGTGITSVSVAPHHLTFSVSVACSSFWRCLLLRDVS